MSGAGKAASGRPLIELRGIRKRYGGSDGQPVVDVLRGIDLRIAAGEFVAIVGASGSGKSTLMHLLGCLDRPSEGQYLFNGEDVSTLDEDQRAWLRREALGFVFQGYHLIATESAQENVEVPGIYAGLGEDERRRRAAALLERLGLAGKLHLRPAQLSGGQQQRVSIARALMNGGRVILADEPTGALDSRSGEEVMRLLRELADGGHTVILITHDRSVAERAARVIEIRDGCIVADSGPAASGQAAALDLPAAGAAHGEGPRDERRRLLSELHEAARTAWRGMRLNRMRTGLTLLGIVIGVASVIVMLAVGEGARQRVMEQMGAMGTRTMYLGSESPPAGGPPGQITAEDLDALRGLPELSAVLPVIGDPIPVRHGNVDRIVYVYSAAHYMPQMQNWRVALGRYYTEAEDRELAALAVVGHRAARRFFPGDADPRGRRLLIGNSPFEVIGVMAERGADSGDEDYDDMVFIPYQSGRARVYRVQTQPDYVVLQAASSGQVLAAEAAIHRVLLARHGREDFHVGNAAARLQAEQATHDSMSAMLGLIAAVSLLVGGIGVMNVMLMTVKERTREIGIRVATGARQRDILRQFLTEAVLVTLAGGAVGVAAGLVVGGALMAAGVSVVFSVSAILGAFSCAALTGVVFGYMPANSAARLDPVVALAGE